MVSFDSINGFIFSFVKLWLTWLHICIGYDGDGSDSGEDGAKNELDIRSSKLPPFWMIFKLMSEQAIIYFHCR